MLSLLGEIVANVTLWTRAARSRAPTSTLHAPRDVACNKNHETWLYMGLWAGTALPQAFSRARWSAISGIELVDELNNTARKHWRCTKTCSLKLQPKLPPVLVGTAILHQPARFAEGLAQSYSIMVWSPCQGRIHKSSRTSSLPSAVTLTYRHRRACEPCTEK